MKRAVTSVLLLCSSLFAWAQPASKLAQAGGLPKVVFLGDSFTYQWQQTPQFLANPNWIGMGFVWSINSIGSYQVLAQMQGIVRAGQHPIVHVMIGGDFDVISPGQDPSGVFAQFAYNMEQIIKLAKQNNIQLIVGLVPYTIHTSVGLYNHWLLIYCAAHGVPTVNYWQAPLADLTVNGPGARQPPPPPIDPVTLLPVFTDSTVITTMVQTQIGLTSGTLKLTHGYLQNVTYSFDGPEWGAATSTSDNNSVSDGDAVIFAAYGQYSDGTTRIMNNYGANGAAGTWASDAPLVVTPGQFGQAYGTGTAHIKFTSPSGVTFYEWTMFVGAKIWGDPNPPPVI